jgi:hypothetical protein
MSNVADRQTLMTAERFASGFTYDSYKAQMKQNLARFEKFERENVLPDADIEAFRALPRTLRTVVLTEDWCSDAVATLPLLAALAERSGKLDVRIVLRDSNLDLMDAHLNKGKFRSIPTFIFYDDDWNEVGAWLEKPATIADLRVRLRHEIYASDEAFGSPDAPSSELPDAVRERLWAKLTRMRDDTTPECNREVIRELRELLLERAR